MSQQVSAKSKIDFSNGKIYILRNTVNDLTYIGSTCQSLSKRMAQHRRDSRNKQHNTMKLYVLMKELGVDSFYIELLENCPCKTREELYKREGECMRNHQSALNNKIQGRTGEEYRKEEREKILVRKKEHYKKNQAYYKQKVKEYKETHKEYLDEKRKEHREKNRDKLIEKQMKRYNENKDEINQIRREKMKQKKEENENYRKELNKTYREWYAKNKEKQCQRRKELRQMKKQEQNELSNEDELK